MALTAEQLRDAIEYAWSARSVSDADALAFVTREGPTCEALVEQYAANAPAAVKESACVRILGALAEGRFGAYQSNEVKAINMSAVFRISGAQGLLAPFKIHRAEPVGGDA